MTKIGLIVSVLLNAVLIWKVGSDQVRSHSSVRESHFTPDSAARYSEEFQAEPTDHAKPSLLAQGSPDRDSRAEARRGAGTSKKSETTKTREPGGDLQSRWEDRVASVFQNDLRLSPIEVEKYHSIRFGYLREIADYVAQHASPGAEYFVPTLEDQRAMMQIKDRYTAQVRQTLGEENFAAYQQLLKDFNAASARNAARSPAGELAIVEF